MEKTQNKKIAIISNDAGGAEILCKWIYENPKNKFVFSLKGPALNIFKINKIKYTNLSYKEAVKKSDIVFTGTSLKSNHELNAIKLAIKNKINTYSFLDHWINYCNRFKRGKKNIIPKTIFVIDRYAFSIAKKKFGKKVKLLNNFYFKSIKKNKFKFKFNNKILYLSSNNDLNLKKQFISDKEIFNRFLIKFKKEFKKYRTLLIRLHPTEKDQKYNKIIINNNYKIKIKIDKSKNIYEALKKVSVVAGFDSMGLVIAKLKGLKSFNLKLKNSFEKNYIPDEFVTKTIKI